MKKIYNRNKILPRCSCNELLEYGEQFCPKCKADIDRANAIIKNIQQGTGMHMFYYVNP